MWQTPACDAARPPARPPARCSDSPAGDTGMRRVALRGRFLPDREVLVTPRSPPHGTPEALVPPTSNNGVFVVTPFVDESGRAVLVQRGWWPAGVVPTPPPSGAYTLAGVLRAGEDVSAQQQRGALVCARFAPHSHSLARHASWAPPPPAPHTHTRSNPRSRASGQWGTILSAPLFRGSTFALSQRTVAWTAAAAAAPQAVLVAPRQRGAALLRAASGAAALPLQPQRWTCTWR